MRVLVLGGTSLTGPFVVRRLHRLGHHVTVFHRGQHEAEIPDGVHHLHGDLAHPPTGLRDSAPDVVVHMWALTEAHAAAFLRLFRGAAGRAVVISSCDVYRAYGRLKRLEPGPPDPLPLSEDAPLRESRYPYRGTENLPIDCAGDYDKILVESTLRAQSALPVTILRFPAVYGRNDNHRFGPWLDRMRNETEIRIQDDYAQWRWTHGYAENVAEAVVLAVTSEAAAGRTYNVGESDSPSWAERLQEWGHMAGWDGRVVPVPAADLPANLRVPFDFSHHLVTDTGRIRDHLGYREVVSRQYGIAQTIAWENDSPE